MEKKEAKNKQLSSKRWIPMLVFFVIGLCILPFKNSTPYIVEKCICILNHEIRASVINLLGLIVGLFHFYYVGRHNESHPQGIVRNLTGVFTSIGSTIGYSYMINSSLTFAIGVLNDFFNLKQFFVPGSNVNYFPLTLVTVFIVFISGYLMWKKAEECIYEINNPSIEAEGIKNPEAIEVEKSLKTDKLQNNIPN